VLQQVLMAVVAQQNVVNHALQPQAVKACHAAKANVNRAIPAKVNSRN
jgi:hypothetical protein